MAYRNPLQAGNIHINKLVVVYKWIHYIRSRIAYYIAVQSGNQLYIVEHEQSLLKI